MAVIDIPDAYWTIQPRRFGALVSNFAPAFAAVAGDVAAGAAPVVNGNDLALRQELAAVDGDRDTIRADAAAEVNALATTPTGQAVAATSAADGKNNATDSSVASISAYDVPGMQIQPPPYPPTDDSPAPPKGGGDTPGQPEPPPRDPNTPPAPIIAELNALYEELLGREIDDSGLNTWVGEITLHGHDLAWVREQIMASPEYQQKHAAPPPPAEPPPPPIDPAQFVTHEQLAAVVDGLDLTINLLV
jgi:hypothetical protein